MDITHVATATVAAVILFGGSAVARADGPGGGPVSFVDQWIAHDSQLQLAQGGVGTFTVGDGATNTDQWSVTWKKNPSDSNCCTCIPSAPDDIP